MNVFKYNNAGENWERDRKRGFNDELRKGWGSQRSAEG